MKWRYGGVRHGTSAGKRRDTAFGVLALLHQENRPTLLGHAEPTYPNSAFIGSIGLAGGAIGLFRLR